MQAVAEAVEVWAAEDDSIARRFVGLYRCYEAVVAGDFEVYLANGTAVCSGS